MTFHLRPEMRAEIIAVGSELLTPIALTPTHCVITAGLNDIGIEVAAKHIVGDRHADLLAVLRASLRRSSSSSLTGGLGPTDDDITRTSWPRRSACRSLEDADGRSSGSGHGSPLAGSRCPTSTAGRRSCRRVRRSWRTITGRRPGSVLEHDGRAVVLLPGPPREMQPMFDTVVRAAPGAAGGDARRDPAARALHHGPHRIAGRRACAARLRSLAVGRCRRSARRSCRCRARSSCT